MKRLLVLSIAFVFTAGFAGAEASATATPEQLEEGKKNYMTICVACSLSTQRQRLLTRGWSSQQIQQRLDAQWSVEKKIAASTFVIWTEGGLDIHAAQLDRILRSLAPA